MLLFLQHFFFVSMKKGFMLSQSEKAPEGQIHFIASKNFQNIDFFQNITTVSPNYNFSNLKVYINGELTDQTANSISANADDEIIIKATRGKYPWFGRYDSSFGDYIKSIEEPFPLMYQANGETITNFNACFYNCYSLTGIPAGLFDNNPQVTSFDSCFYNCESLTSIPIGLFDNNPQVTNFSFCFSYCKNLSSIPAGLFDNNPQVTNFSYCFYRCSSLIVNVQIGSTASSVNVRNFAYDTKEKGTVYCRAGSAAYVSFSNTIYYANVNVLTY